MVAPIHCIGKPMTNSRLLPTHGATQTTTPLSYSLSWWILMKEELRHFSRLEMGAVICEYMINTCTCIELHLRQLIFLRNSDCLRYTVLLCLVVCLTLLASFFLPFHLSLKHVQYRSETGYNAFAVFCPHWSAVVNTDHHSAASDQYSALPDHHSFYQYIYRSSLSS